MLQSINSRIAYLDKLIKDDYDGKVDRPLVMMLLYWKIFDGIDISDELMKKIIDNGTSPNSLVRAIRRIRHKKTKP